MKLSIMAAAGLALAGVAPASTQQVRFDDVVRNLRNPDAGIRMDSLRLLRESRHPEAIGPIAPLVNDPVDRIQLEAIATELSFFLAEDVSPRKRVALVIEKRSASHAAAAFEAGPIVTLPRPVPAELIRALLQASDDEQPQVRLEAIYALGVIARAPFPAEFDAALIRVLDHYDPAMRAAAAKVVGRLGVARAGDELIRAVNDSNAAVRYAAMRSLGYIREERAVPALADQLAFYGRGEGAWSALDGLARIGHPSSVPLFKSRLTDRDPMLRRAAAEGLGRSGDTTQVAALDAGASTDRADTVRAAMLFALHKAGRDQVSPLARMMASPKLASQVTEYFVELGPATVPALLALLKDPDGALRAGVAVVLGVIGGEAALPALQGLTQDRDPHVARSATRAVERITVAQRGGVSQDR